ncbi:MAG: MarR family winged helix-turn-helix transcriptional regulator [Acidimicrobiia bacterium]|nr:MarR family winged helix-turn-helix transcriptional regulator [Acidimicrobiia bacterium]
MPRRDRTALSDADYANLARFRHLLHGFFEFSESAARREGLTPAQHQLLLAVRGHPGPGAPNVSDIAAALFLKHHSAGELVARTEAAGLVHRVADPSDARQHRLALTDAGEAVLGALTSAHRDELTRLRTDLIGLLADLG